MCQVPLEITMESQNLKAVLIAGVTVFVIMLGIVLLKSPSKSEQHKAGVVVTPTISQETKTDPPVLYKKERNDKMLEILDTRPALSGSDKAIRAKLTALRNPLQNTNEYSLEYLSSPDEFMVEIRTVDINSAKEKVIAWLKNTGLSDEGICHLPVVFYLNYATANSLRGMNMQFDPLPPGC